MNLKIFLILFFSLSFYASNAQIKYSLKDCITLALEKSLQLKQTYLSQNIADNNFKQSKNNLLPSVGLDMTGGMSIGNSLNPTTYEVQFRNAYTSTIGVSAQMILFNGLQQINNIDRTKFLSESAKTDIESFKNNLALTVANNYLQIVLAKEIIEAAKIQSRNLQEQMNRTINLIEAGVLPKGNLLELQAQKAKDELNLVKVQSSYQLLEFQMKQLLLIPLNQEILFEQPFAVKVSDYDVENIETIINSAVVRLPQIKSEELKVRSAKKQWQMAQGAFSPNLALSYSSGSNFISTSVDRRDSIYALPPVAIGSGFNSANNSTILINSLPTNRVIQVADGSTPYLFQLQNNLSHRFTLSLNFSIFAKFQRMTNASNAKIQWMSQNLQLDIAKNKLREEVYSAYIQYKNAKKTYYAAEENIKAFNNAYEFAKEKYNLGSINSFEFSTSLSNRQNADSELLRAKFEYFFRKVVLDFYNGSVLNIE